jgi:serine protease inhibitor
MMMRVVGWWSRPALVAVLVCAVLSAVGCGAGEAEEVGQTVRSDVAFAQVDLADAAGAGSVVAASDRFGLQVLAGSDATTNLVFSPASAFVALAMLAEGATNTGAAELDSLLGSSGEARSEAVNALAGVLAPFAGDPAAVTDEDLPQRPVVHLATNVVLDEQAEVSATFLDRLAEFYDAGVAVTDLAGAQGTRVLDAWVREHTGGRVEKSAITPNDDLYLVLQDAILFAARWQQEFDPSVTSDATFTSSTGQTQTAPMMRGLQDLPYAQVDGWASILLPYQDGFTAQVVLPPVGVDPASIDPGTLDQLDAALATATPSSVAVVLPRFETDSTINLIDVLSGQGLTAIFDPASQPLQAITTDVDLFVGQAVQQATITVGEQGTVAAAVTEIAVGDTGAPPEPEYRFIADRPFLMIVAETTTGWDLFQTVVRTID